VGTGRLTEHPTKRRKHIDCKYDLSVLTTHARVEETVVLYEHRLNSVRKSCADCWKTRWSQSVLSPNSCGRAQPDLHAER
jgi:hypothetical protein